ncbi:TetR/AcrR family transcriptional regulator [Mycobacterium sp. 236(2023)]|uniref:TetR/AcrR family transcriptional regulator n=1 Tax=Mycobacterium sp. 236(2023) TaxID=3038163 RepID=UPI002414F46E|nr:TetR/AcrR family transcriptional regulator [Mycobacterium sp. 236(2023)]MDG4669217.1 TetR/AcrR family transcriptional regulator [Mycobacterium sp. 236(2023)]
MAAETDTRRASSRAQILKASTMLMRSGGPSAITVDAVTRISTVARATLYRHFASTDALLAATFTALLPPVPRLTTARSLRDRLVKSVLTHFDSASTGGSVIAAMSWLMLAAGDECAERATLRTHLIRRCVDPIEAALCTPSARKRLGDVDVQAAATQILGPVVLAEILQLDSVDRCALARASVDAFLGAHSASS